jgi:hypothetical protein
MHSLARRACMGHPPMSGCRERAGFLLHTNVRNEDASEPTAGLSRADRGGFRFRIWDEV